MFSTVVTLIVIGILIYAIVRILNDGQEEDFRTKREHDCIWGIWNQGNMCYVNAGVQLLLSSEEFRMVLEKQAGRQKQIMHALYALMDKRSTGSSKSILQMISKRTKKYKNHRQEDCNQFLIDLLDQLQKEQPKTIQIFRFDETCLIKCPHNHDSCIQSTNLMLTIPLEPISISVSHQISKLMETEIIPCYYCHDCQVKRNATMKKGIDKLPSNLLICYQSVRYSKRRLKKQAVVMVGVPDLQIVVEETRFGLVGVVMHIGKAERGHYYCLRKFRGRWYKLDDERVRELPNYPTPIKNESIYILLYQQHYKID